MLGRHCCPFSNGSSHKFQRYVSSVFTNPTTLLIEFKDELTPHAPGILLFATSAQTHIFPEIRLDAIRFLDLFLEFIPHIVVDGWSEPGNTHGKRVLDGYFGLLNAGSKFGENDGMFFYF